jgi:hypothetical protein
MKEVDMTKHWMTWTLLAAVAVSAAGCGCGAMAPAALQERLVAASTPPSVAPSQAP